MQIVKTYRARRFFNLVFDFFVDVRLARLVQFASLGGTPAWTLHPGCHCRCADLHPDQTRVSHHQIRATRNIQDCPAVSGSLHRTLVPAASLGPDAASSGEVLYHRSALPTSTNHTTRTFLPFRRPRQFRLVSTLHLLLLFCLLSTFIILTLHIHNFLVLVIRLDGFRLALPFRARRDRFRCRLRGSLARDQLARA